MHSIEGQMSNTASLTTPEPAIGRARTFKIRQIAIPVEHGGWSFLLEPLIAGTAIAFSVGGLWIALMTIGAFLCRQPLKVLIADRIGMKDASRATAALVFLMTYASIFAIGILGTLIASGSRPLLPCALVLPLVGYQIFNDVSRRGRQLAPELCGAVSLSASIAAFAIAGGQTWAVAASLWTIFVLRSIPSILYVRNRLLLEKGKEHSRIVPTIAHVFALFITCTLVYFGLGPILTIFAMLVLLGRSVTGLAPGRKKLPAMQIGLLEIGYGAIIVVSVVAGHFLGL
ncbi:MAG: YwiC-like family protein [Pyrinomonadaceae bacterium]